MLTRECQMLLSRFTHLTIFLCLSLFLMACGHSTEKFLAKGEEYLQKHKFHEALMQFRSADESDKDSAKAHWGLARAYENLGQFNETMDELRKAVELDGSNLEAKAKLANYFLLVQPPLTGEAEKIRDEILKADPRFIEGHILTASIIAAQGKPDAEVVATINKAIALDPKRIESYVSLERYYMSHEKAPDAEAGIQKGIAVNPSSPLGYAEYGRFLMYANRDADAEAQFNKAVAIDPASIETREAVAEFFVTSRQMAKAEAAYKDLVNIQENSPESRHELAEFYLTATRKDDAIAVLDQILADVPDYVLARYKLGHIYLDRKDPAKLNEQLDALFKLNDADIEALMLRARLKMQESKSDEAVKDLEDILKKLPSERDALFLIAQAKLSIGQIEQANAFIADLERYHPTFIKAGLLKIQAAFSTGDAEAARKRSNDLLDKANATTPNAETNAQAIQDLRIRATSSRGLALLDLGKLPEAKADLQSVVKMSPNSSAAMVNLAKAFTAERNDQGALDLYEKALTADPQSFDAVSGIVTTSIKMRQTAKAHAKVDEQMSANAGRADILAALYYLNSTIFAAEKNPAASEQELTKSIAADENYLPAYSAYASMLVAQNRTDEAIAQYQKVAEKKPAAPMFTLLGILEDARGNTGEAEKNYRQALGFAPESPIAANNLAWLIAENQGNLDEALQLATGVVARNQTVAGYYDTLGWVYLKKGLYLPAVEQFKKAVTLDEKGGSPANPGYRVRLGMALAHTSDKASARREVETSLKNENALSQREVMDARSVLASL